MSALLSRAFQRLSVAQPAVVGTSAAGASATGASAVLSTAFSTSSVSQISKKKRQRARVALRRHREKKSALARERAQTQPDPVLGYNVAFDNDKWRKSELKALLLDRAQVWGALASESDEAVTASQDSYVPEHFNFGIDQEMAHTLQDTLPQVSALRATLNPTDPLAPPQLFDEAVHARLEKAEEVEAEKRDKVMRIVDLRNASSKGIAIENVRRITLAFGENEMDTGRPEVQAAVLTARIHALTAHLAANRHDVANAVRLRHMVHRRQKVLKYLHNIDVKRYDVCLRRIGVDKRAIEGEVIVTTNALRALLAAKRDEASL